MNRINVLNYTIATLGSHSALQILKGAKDEGFKALCICLKSHEKPYRMFGVADEFILLDSYSELLKVDRNIARRNVIIVPHASFIAYIGFENVEKLKTKYFGNKKILRWEADRKKERAWLDQAHIRQPKVFSRPREIDRPVIIKFHGAGGGNGYFLARNEHDFSEKIKYHPHKQYIIQEYIIGVPVYAHFFYSILDDKLELLGFDKRYESNADSLGRISARDQLVLRNVDPSYYICGNMPIVVRESFLPEIIEMAERVVTVSKTVAPPGLFGPFCLELIIKPDGTIYCFEISARIVAGTNPYVGGSPYADLLYGEPMSMGRRIAREIKQAIEQDKLTLLMG